MVLKITEIYPEYKMPDKMQNTVLYDKHMKQERTVFSKNMIIIDSELKNDINKSREFVKAAKELQDDIDRFDLKSKENKENIDTSRKALYALSPLPPLRRISSLPDSIENNNLPRAAGLLGLAAVNLPGDWREIIRAGDDLKNIFTTKNISSVSSEAQRPLKFLKGTFLEFLSVKFKWLDKMDKTLYRTKFGGFLKNSLNIKESGLEFFKNTGLGATSQTGRKFEGNYFSKLTGKALLRVPVIGLAAMSLLEMPALIKSAKKGETINEKAKSFVNQLCKSIGYITLVTAGIAVAGAVFVTAGTAASLIGMAIGSTLGLIASRQVNKQIDKIIV